MPNKATTKPTTGVILMTYGSATTAEHVGEYIRHIYGDKASAETIADFEERYRLVGRSPLVDITRVQAAALEKFLNSSSKPKSTRYLVRAGMLHSEPFIDAAVAELRAAGAGKLIGIILSPQFSSFIMDGYRTALIAAGSKHGFTKTNIVVAKPWPTESHFIQLLGNRVTDALAKLEPKFGPNISVIFTTHSLPERVVAKDPTYLDQLKATTDAVVARLANPQLNWFSAYQSAGHTPEPWLKPDLVDILADLRDQRQPAVLIVPIQFLTDHLEILYDLDIAGAEQCQEFAIAYNRIELPNTDPLFIQALASVVAVAK